MNKHLYLEELFRDILFQISFKILMKMSRLIFREEEELRSKSISSCIQAS